MSNDIYLDSRGLDMLWNLRANLGVFADGAAHGNGTSHFLVGLVARYLIDREGLCGAVGRPLVHIWEGGRDRREGRGGHNLLRETHVV